MLNQTAVKGFNFSGYATKANVKCTDGRTILKDAFKDCNGLTVPLVWNHSHNSPDNILGHAVLENRDDGVYAYCFLNDTSDGQKALKLIQHKDIVAMSIYANQLVEKSKQVIHGIIREVSLVLAGANPGAIIDNLVIAHADGEVTALEDEARMYFISENASLDLPVVEIIQPKVEETNMEKTELAHVDQPAGEKTVGDVWDTLNEEQKTVVYAMIAQIMDDDGVAQSNITDGDEDVKFNVFENSDETRLAHAQPRITSEQFK